MQNNRIKLRYNPISEDFLVIGFGGCNLEDLAKSAAQTLEAYPQNTVIVSGSPTSALGGWRMEIKPDDPQRQHLAAVDFLESIYAHTGLPSAHMFDCEAEADGSLKAAFSDRAAPYETIFAAAFGAKQLSQQHNNHPVTFEFRNRQVTVRGTDDICAIEASFPETQRRRQDYTPPPVTHYYS